ncbi:MAG: cytochrome c [Gammaproteobacteria bacterium]|jgi:cytochrome c
MKSEKLITVFMCSKAPYLVRVVYSIIAIGFLSSSSAWADESLFNQHCGACHTLNAEDAPRQGPSLEGIIGRKAGSVENFPYSKSLKFLDVSWDAEYLDQWITKPQDLAADSYMMYSQSGADIRSALILFLQSQ